MSLRDKTRAEIPNAIVADTKLVFAFDQERGGALGCGCESRIRAFDRGKGCLHRALLQFPDWPSLCLYKVASMEMEILQVLRQSAGVRFSYKEIGKMVDRHQFRENAHFARPVLERLTCEGLIWKQEAFYVYPTEEQKRSEE